jgi:hypothetical protein
MRIVALLGFLALGGCAMQWSRPGATEEDLYRDSAECRMRGLEGAGAPNLLARAIEEKCMQAKGWRPK